MAEPALWSSPAPSLRPCVLAQDEASRFALYTAERVPASAVAPGDRLIVNSVPKSGSAWMIAMLGTLFGRSADHAPELVHVGDIRSASRSSPVFGVVVLVRDMRDVVLSWFHETRRNDLRAGFHAPRYPTVEAFYHEHLLGLMRSQPRFDHGPMTAWLDHVTAQGFPLIRYEDLSTDPQSCLTKLANFWKVDVPPDRIADAVTRCTFDNMPLAARNIGGWVGQAVANGHLRRGRVGDWRETLPPAVADDVAQRFADYQSRLSYR